MNNIKKIAENRKAFHEYFVLDTFEAGISLSGTEIKSIRSGGANLKDSWCEIKNSEAFVHGMHISPYREGNIFNKDPLRLKKLLLHKKEIRILQAKVKEDGKTLIPLSLYFKGSYVKLALGVCEGKKLYDKRKVDAQKDAKREIERTLKSAKNNIG